MTFNGTYRLRDGSMVTVETDKETEIVYELVKVKQVAMCNGGERAEIKTVTIRGVKRTWDANTGNDRTGNDNDLMGIVRIGCNGTVIE